MARTIKRPDSPLNKVDPRFEGSTYSVQECNFLLEHLGEPAMIAMPPDEELPDGVNEDAVTPILDRTFELEMYQNTLRDKSGDSTLTIWCGFDKLRAILKETNEWRATVAELKRRTRGSSPELRLAAASPSLHLWDPSTDVAYFGGIGADAERVLTSLDEEGVRHELYTELQQTGEGSIKTLAGVAKFIKSKTDAEMAGKTLALTPEDLDYVEGSSYAAIVCPICKKAENYETAKPNTKRQAYSKMMKHLETERVNKVEQHRLLATRINSGRAGARQNRRPAQADSAPEAEA